MDYQEFLQGKVIEHQPSGFEVSLDSLNSALFEWQKLIVRWSLFKGRSALFAGCGLGKSPMQLEWANQVCSHTGGNVLILAPLAVSAQTVREGVKFGIQVHKVRSQSEVQPGINITNYEMVEQFDPREFAGVVLDESSILKAFMGKTRRYLQDTFQATPYKLCCTATPAPNDHMELGNHAEFLNIMPSNEMLARWFINDTSQAGNYRLKQHAIKPFWEWVSTWAVCLSKPSDLGFDNGAFELPELKTHEHIVEIEWTPKDGKLVDIGKPSATDMYKELRKTAEQRTDKTAEMVNESDETWIVWCNTNNESEMLARKIPDAIEVKGSMSNQAKEDALESFVSGKARVMVGKPSMCGFGLNLQHCHNMAFVGLSYSFEQRYQAIRRCWRFGQEHPVNDHVIVSPKEYKIFRAVQEKAVKHQQMEANMVANVNEFTNLETKRLSLQTDYKGRLYKNHNWEIIHGDSCKEMARLDSNSMHFSIHSPPFAQLYIYSDYVQDLGNCKSYQEFFHHYSFVVKDLFRITKPGRLAAVHCKQLVTYKNRDGRSGITDFRGDIIKLYEKHGWKYHSEICIWKDPVTEMQRTKAQGLLHKQIKKDSSLVRQGLPDYLVIFRKWPEGEEETESVHRPEGLCEYVGENSPTVVPKNEKDQIYSIHVWQRYASPVWWDIDQMNVLNYRRGKGEKDEKHICPLQLQVIERAIHLWTNPGDTVFTPFAGIGSEVYSAVKMKRKAIGIELKEEYVKTALKNMEILKQKNAQGSLLDIAKAKQEVCNA